MDQHDHHSPVLGHFRASLESCSSGSSSVSNVRHFHPIGNPHRSINTRVRNRFRNTRGVPSSRYYPTDINNNQTRVIIHPVNPVNSQQGQMISSQTFKNLPPVSSVFGFLQLFLYFTKEYLFNVTKDEDVYVSWKTVMTRGEFWRLFYAQFFTFSKVLLFFNFVTLMAMGRFLEKKIKWLPYALLIMFSSLVSNLLYIFINDMFCSGPNTEFTVGFGTTMFSLRMIHIFTMDSNANNGKGDPNLVFGFLPIHLPVAIAPWQPLVETIFFDVAIIGRCVAANISGMCAGLIFPWLMKNFRSYIMLPRNPPPPPPRRRSRHTVSTRSTESSNGDTSDENGNNNRPNIDDVLHHFQQQNVHMHDS